MHLGCLLALNKTKHILGLLKLNISGEACRLKACHQIGCQTVVNKNEIKD